jgi:hypothetical protein
LSIQFNDTTYYKGLAQLYAEEIGLNPTALVADTEKMKKFTARVNLALDRYFSIAVQASGTWELDDSNHTGNYAVIYTTLAEGQRDYPILTDENGNAILDIYKVLVLPSATSTIYQELYPVDETLPENISFLSEQNVEGQPTRYAKRSNAVHLDAIPSYTVARGLKILVNRESSYFTYTDTTKKPGYPYHQEYFFLKPAYDQARINGNSNLPQLEREILKLEGDPLTGRVGLIAKAYGNRSKDEVQRLTAETINSI